MIFDQHHSRRCPEMSDNPMRDIVFKRLVVVEILRTFCKYFVWNKT